MSTSSEPKNILGTYDGTLTGATTTTISKNTIVLQASHHEDVYHHA
jgi:hypothetical protein